MAYSGKPTKIVHSKGKKTMPGKVKKKRSGRTKR